MVYKTNFLSKVVYRIDFDQIKLGKIGEYSEKVKKDFPLFEEKKGLEGTVNFDFKTNEVKQASSQIITWIFYNKERTKRIVINPNFLSLEYDKYTDSKELLNDINYISSFITDFGISAINRMGLRYVNEVKVKDKNLLDWKKYFDNDLISPLNFIISKKKKLARVMNQIIIKEDFGNISLNYGIWNSNFPNEVIEKMFVVDIDAYSKFPLSTESLGLTDLVKEYNKKIEELFESIIKDDLRTILNG